MPIPGEGVMQCGRCGTPLTATEKCWRGCDLPPVPGPLHSVTIGKLRVNAIDRGVYRFAYRHTKCGKVSFYLAPPLQGLTYKGVFDDGSEWTFAAIDNPFCPTCEDTFSWLEYIPSTIESEE